MSDRWVVNASPLIVLARMNALHLLSELAEQIVVPTAVVTEILAGPAEDPARQAVERGAFKSVDQPALDEILAWDLGAGESAVLSYALNQKGWVAIIDDGAARKCARSLNIPHRGTLGIVLLAKQRGIIPSAAQLIRRSMKAGLRIDERMLTQLLWESVGENWQEK